MWSQNKIRTRKEENVQSKRDLPPGMVAHALLSALGRLRQGLRPSVDWVPG